MTEWQDISTAPKDGTPILIWALRGKCCFVANYHTEYHGNDVRWQEAAGGLYNIIATHWMPLPEPPQ